MKPENTVGVLVTCPTCAGRGHIEIETHVSLEDGQADGYREACPDCEGDGVMVAIYNVHDDRVADISHHERVEK